MTTKTFKILTLLEQCPLTFGEIRKMTNIDKNVLNLLLYKLKKRKLIETKGKFLHYIYCLTPKGRMYISQLKIREVVKNV